MPSDEQLLFPELHAARFGDGRRRERLILPKKLSQAARDLRLRGPEQEAAHAILARWAELEASGRLAQLSEVQLQGEFLTDVFGGALGYALFSEALAEWNLWPQFSVNGGAADAAIGRFASGQPGSPRVVIELKGPTVNVDRDRFNGRTPVQQCWDYLNALPHCPWGIVCNYVSFRLYHRERTPRAYELFTLQELGADPDRFREFWVLFERAGLLPAAAGQLPRADDLLAQSEQQQREVGDELYRGYRDERAALVAHLRGKPHQKSLDEAIHIAQKLLDRIIFIAFCEDRGLLPRDSIASVFQQVQRFTRAKNPVWQHFRELFALMDAGDERSGVSRFNGGLFEPDALVDGLELDDNWTRFFRELAGYDFEHEVNVEVLGRLFEQSITDLEILRVGDDAQAAPQLRKSAGRRKREGIYYTPPHITDYIVRHTVGAGLEQRFADAAQRHGITPEALASTRGSGADGPDAGKQFDYHRECLAALRALRVCDPACGSGAFLVRAYDYLLGVYEEISERLSVLGQPDPSLAEDLLPDLILRENLFGVDLSDEAVEITRLALWLRTARRGQTLADLDANIRRGNSLVDDPAVDPHAFNWPANFPQVFAAGGFDALVGNPPYVKLQNFRKRAPEIAAYLVKSYRAAQTGNFDLYLPFIERGLALLRPGGRLGIIAPNVWLFNEYGRGLRELVAEKRALTRFVDFKSHQVFADATTYTALQFFTAAPSQQIEVADARGGDLEALRFYPVTYAGRGGAAWALLDEREQGILDMLRAGNVTLGEASEQIFQGLITSADAVYHLIKLGTGRYYSRALAQEVELDDEVLKPLISGEDAVPFATPPTDKYLLFPYRVTDDECRLLTAAELKREHKRTWAYFKENEALLRGREDGKFDDDEWWRFGRNQSIDKQERPKLLVPRLLLKLFAGGDPQGTVYLDNVDVGGILVRKGWDLHFILGILNSAACNFAWRTTSKPFRGEYRSANKQFIAPLPIPQTKDQRGVARLARTLADLYGQRLTARLAVERRLATDLPPAELVRTSVLPPSLPGRLRTFWEGPVGGLLDGLEKLAERRFKPAERANWDEFLTAQRETEGTLTRRIQDATAELNERVNELYGLTQEQVKVIAAAGA